MGAPRARRSGHRGATLTVATVPTKLARQQIASLRGKAKASFLLAVEGPMVCCRSFTDSPAALFWPAGRHA